LYYVIYASSSTFKLATSRANALAGTAVDLTATTNLTLKRILDDLEAIYVVPTGSARDGSQGAWVRKFSGPLDVRWFGAAVDGSTDDQEALQAALDYAAAIGSGLYDGGYGHVRLPAGTLALGSSIDLTAHHNVTLSGEGDGSSYVLGTGDFPIFTASDPTSAPLYRFIANDFTIQGPGNTNTNAHGIDIAANNNCQFRNLRIWACRRGLSYSNAWHTEIINIRMNGLGGLANYDGIYAKDGDAAVVENAVGIFGGRIYGCARYGFRGESVTGSSVFGIEVLGCGSIGVYIGDSPSGKDLKWFSWDGGLVDTCPQLVVIKKGTSTVAQDMDVMFSWLGYASDANGIGLDIQGITGGTFGADHIANVQYGINAQNCDRTTFRVGDINGYDHSATGGVTVICNGTTNSRFDIGSTKKAAGSTSTTAFVEQNAANNNHVTGNFDGAITLIGAGSTKIALNAGASSLAFGSLMKSDNGSRLLIGLASQQDSATLQIGTSAGGGNIAVETVADVTTTKYAMMFRNPNGQVGAISTNGTATTFSTSSDERLKKDFEDFDPGTMIDAMRMYRYRWEADGSEGYGPKAQELLAVFPRAVVKGSDGDLPGDQTFRAWGWDASHLVPLLVRELQLLRRRVAALEQ
jgi:hypothetical protein